MADIVLTEDELVVLASCSGVAVKAYLRLRSRMDFDSGVVGLRSGVSYQALREWTEEEVEKGAGMMRIQPSLQAVRTALAQLVRRGLLVRRPVDNLVFLLPLARVGSVRPNQTQHEPNRGRRAVQHTEPNTNQTWQNSSNGAAFVVGGCADPNIEPNANPTDPPPPNPTHIRYPYTSTPQQAACTPDNEGAREEVGRAAAGLVARICGGVPAVEASPQMRRAGALVAMLRKQGVRSNAMDPRLLAWVSDGIADGLICKGVEVARQRRGDNPQPINLGYLDAIVRGLVEDEKRPPALPPWWSSDALAEAKARELGVSGAAVGESREAFHGRIKAAILRMEKA